MRSVFDPLTAGFLSIVLVTAGLLGGCGKDSNDEDAKTAAGQPDSVETLPTGEAPFAAELERAGFEVVYYTDFPAARAARKGNMVVYNSATGGKDGGIVYVEERGPRFDWVWHWYFENAKPKTLSRHEINQDGMWDVRVRTSKGREDRPLELIQHETFTLRGGTRIDRIALNGSSSESVVGNPLWHCFDGDTATAWRSRMDSSQRPFVEVWSPLGLNDGIISIRAAKDGQPRECAILADGKEVQRFQLEPVTGRQLVQLDPAVKTAKRIRLVVSSLHGGSGTAAITELQIR
jgi:hypothetical protein